MADVAVEQTGVAGAAGGAAVSSAEHAGNRSMPSIGQAYVAAAVLAVAQMCATLNNGVTTLLVEAIKRDLQLSDMQMGYLLGFAGVVFYALIGIPAARLADRYNRKWLLAASIMVWSAATAACGVAGTFWQFFAARFGIGAGESINGPLSYSLLADYFPPNRLPRGIAIYNVGLQGGGALSLLLGAFLIQLFAKTPVMDVPLVGPVRDWQMVFIITGLIGLPVTLLVMALSEPPRRSARLSAVMGMEAKDASLMEVLAYLLRNWRLYGPMFLGLSLTSIHMMGMGNWIAAFFARTYGWQPSTFGSYSGLLTLVLAAPALIGAIWVNELFHKRGHADTNMRVMAMGITAAAPFMIAAPLMPSPWLALIFNAIGPAFMLVAAPSLNTALQIVTPNEMRGRVTAIYLFIMLAAGGSIGPTLFAFLTEHVFGDPALLRYSILTSAVLTFPTSALVYWLGVKAYRERILAMRAAGQAV